MAVGGDVRVFDAVTGGEALVVIDVGSPGMAAADLRGPGDGRAAACLWPMVPNIRCAYMTRSRTARRWWYSRGIRKDRGR